MNMRSIAQRAGVSSATVSRVLNGSSAVKEATARRVQAVLDETGFIPNPFATTLKYGRSRTYGLIIPDIRNPFYSEFLGDFEEFLVEAEHEVLLTVVQSREKLVKSVRRMLMRQVDGAVLMASEFDTEHIEPLFRHKIPIVTVDRRAVQAGCSDVSIDFEDGFVEAVRHLRRLGHMRIGYIGGIPGLRTTAVRQDAFRNALERSGLSPDPQLICAGDYRIVGGERAAFQLMALPNRPTALLTANDLTAFGAIRGLHALGLSVPQDVSLVGLDDVLLCEVMQPTLTTIRIPRKRMAETCLQALTATKQDVERQGALFTVPADLIVRESTGPAPRPARPGARR